MTTARQGRGQIAYIQGQVSKKRCLSLTIFPLSSLSNYIKTIWQNYSQQGGGPSQVAQMVKCLPAMQKTRVQSLGREDPLEKEMATHSSILAWEIPWTEEPSGLESMGSQRVINDLVTKQEQQI